MASEAKLRANSKSNKINTKMICVRLSYNTDADIIKKLDEVDSKMGYIKELIRKDIQTKKMKEAYQMYAYLFCVYIHALMNLDMHIMD